MRFSTCQLAFYAFVLYRRAKDMPCGHYSEISAITCSLVNKIAIQTQNRKERKAKDEQQRDLIEPPLIKR